MEYCSKCFKKLCRCGANKIDIDYYIYPAIFELNRKGYRTASCCSGHENDSHLSTYVSFYEEIKEDINSEYFQYDSYNYRGFHERRDRIRLKPEIVKKFNKKRTNKLELIQAVNKDLYAWAKRLPSKIHLEDNEIDLPANYFDEERELDEVVDLQKPWILFAKAAKGCVYTLDDFFNEIECQGDLTEFVVNRSGRIKNFCEQDYTLNRTYLGNSSFLRGKVEFDISGDYKYLLCGYEPYVMIEKLLVKDAVWYLSYARTDIAIGENNELHTHMGDFIEDDTEDWDEYPAKIAVGSKAHNYLENLFDEDDVTDFMDEHPDATEIDLFACLFNRMCGVNINTCVFSAENINIIFSDRINFNVLMTNEQNVVAFGEADYEYMDFQRIHVERKEVFVYANGRLLMRKEIK